MGIKNRLKNCPKSDRKNHYYFQFFIKIKSSLVYHKHGIQFLRGETQDSIGPPRYKGRGNYPMPPPLLPRFEKSLYKNLYLDKGEETGSNLLFIQRCLPDRF